MIILFEGLDKTGKTTIAKELSKITNYPYFKMPLEKDAFKGQYNPEISLIYETRKFLEFVEQNVIKNVIIDRDYASEYVYGKIFREDRYLEYKIDDFIREYDKRYFRNNLIIVYCYKDKNEIEDEVIKKEHFESIRLRYLDFFNKTFNRTLFLNTSDENLVNQKRKVLEYEYNMKKIDMLNENIYKESIDGQKIFFPGSFGGQEILFVGQNPGYPDKNDEQSVKLHTHKFKDYKEFLIEHEISYRKCKYYKFISKFSRLFEIKANCQFSFTNLVKFSKINNEALTKEEIDQNITMLKEQIGLFKPKKIISFGKDAHEALNKLNIEHEGFKHPSAFNYSKTEKFL